MDRKEAGKQRLFEAAIEIVSSGSVGFKRTARRYSLCAQDAEDAYQRGLEILITKAPTTAPDELRPWLHTVIKHEALAIRRQRERLLGGGEELAERAGASFVPEESAAARERMQRAAEALGGLKRSEVQCLLLKALGYSYDEIAARTGFSWTKVNRSLTEGRRHFFARFEQIESGRRCNRFKPLLSVAADGEGDERDRQVLREHLRACSSCRAALRSYRAAPARLAELLPPALVLPLSTHGSWWSRLIDSVPAGAGDRAGALGWKLQQAGEMLSAKKAAAVVASTAALAGGTVAERQVTRDRAGTGTHAVRAAAEPDEAATPPPVAPPGGGATPAAPSPTTADPGEPDPDEPDRARGGEFGLEPDLTATATQASEPAAPDSGETASFEQQGESGPASAAAGGTATGGAAAGAAAGGEFGP